MIFRHAFLAICFALAGCGGLSNASSVGPQPIPFDGYLWQAARETVDFLPLQKTDPDQGLVETGWGSPKGEDSERYRIDVRIDYRRIYTDAATVTVMHQLRSGDAWVDVGHDLTAAAALQKAIGDRAGELRLDNSSSK